MTETNTSDESPKSRRSQREEIFKTLYASEVSGQFDPEAPTEYQAEVVAGVREHREELDEKISRYLDEWRIERIHPIERVLLRIGAYEILIRGNEEKAIVINEAVELAKKFGEDSSASFVNGILDNFPEPNEGSLK